MTHRQEELPRVQHGVPEWYRLDFEPAKHPAAPPHLILLFRKAPLRRFVADLVKMGRIPRIRAQLSDHIRDNPVFRLDTNRPWGFGGVLRPIPIAHETMRRYSIAIPRVERYAGTCMKCRGTCTSGGKSCSACYGFGKIRRWCLNDVECIAATLHVLSPLLYLPKKEWIGGAVVGREQLLAIKTRFGDRSDPEAILSPVFANYLRSRPGQQLADVLGAIRGTYVQMFPSYSGIALDSWAEILDRGTAVLDIHRKEVGLYVSGPVEGCDSTSGALRVNSTGIESSYQWLTLLCALAALSSQASRAIYPDPA